jgi:hypothetical protein
LFLVTYVTAKNVKNKALNNSDNKGFKLKGGITTNLSNDSEPNFDDSDDNVFNLIIRSDYSVQDDFINVD